jgi:hypothetical protein
MMSDSYIISLTTIPSRFSKIKPTLESLLNQNVKPEKIFLNIPLKYRRFDDYENNKIPKLEGITINISEHDYGPATKILPVVNQFDDNKIIIYCDDDIIYDKNWAKNLIETSKNFPNDCICGRGQSVELIRLRAKILANSKNIISNLIGRSKYKKEKKIILKKLNLHSKGCAEIAAGYGVVLVRPRYFTSECFSIPDILWTVDDIWISGHLTFNGITIRTAEPQVNFEFGTVSHINPLTKFVYKDFTRDLANMECIQYFETHYKIWNSAV